MTQVTSSQPIRITGGEYVTLTGRQLHAHEHGAYIRYAWRLRASGGRVFTLHVTRDYHWALYESVRMGGSQLRAHGHGNHNQLRPAFRALTWGEQLREGFTRKI